MKRTWWPDHNPLRRVSDRVEAAIGAGLIVAFLAGAPLLGISAGQWAHSAAQRAERTERAVSHPVSAVVLHSAPPPILTARAMTATTEEPIRWTAPHGRMRTGQVVVPAGTKAGTLLQVWTDAWGRLINPPMMPAQVLQQTVLAAMLTPVALGMVLITGWAVARRVLHLRRLAWWEAQWSVTGPNWTRRR